MCRMKELLSRFLSVFNCIVLKIFHPFNFHGSRIPKLLTMKISLITNISNCLSTCITTKCSHIFPYKKRE